MLGEGKTESPQNSSCDAGCILKLLGGRAEGQEPGRDTWGVRWAGLGCRSPLTDVGHGRVLRQQSSLCAHFIPVYQQGGTEGAWCGTEGEK